MSRVTQWPCPVCGTKVVESCQDRHDGWGPLLESHEFCPNGCWESTFAYGNTEERVGEQVFYSGWNDSPAEERRHREKRDAAVERLKHGEYQGEGSGV